MAFSRIASLLPTATEILFALGVGERVVAVTHECDYPAEANTKTKILDTLVDSRKSSKEIDTQVASLVSNGQSIYKIDGNLFRSLAPDLVITQTQCRVCAVYYDEVQQTIEDISSSTKVVAIEANGIEDILDNIMHLGGIVGAKAKAKELVGRIRMRIEFISSATKNAKKVSTCFVEWIDPIYLGGHWVPEMIEVAGGFQLIQQKWKPSVPRLWEQIVEAAPEVLVICPCSYKMQKTLQEIPLLQAKEGWSSIPAVKNSRVFVSDEGYFSRNGPRFIDGLEILASIIHPEIFGDRFTRGREVFQLSNAY
ncbi:MAG: ABC transporter substrate-binding protein [Thaumarchaeota archaeon]|nr:ABC transporter substrate-binding protein [Nitrososphaerota archaeon]